MYGNYRATYELLFIPYKPEQGLGFSYRSKSSDFLGDAGLGFKACSVGGLWVV